jgi:hypothetical protein
MVLLAPAKSTLKSAHISSVGIWNNANHNNNNDDDDDLVVDRSTLQHLKQPTINNPL